MGYASSSNAVERSRSSSSPAANVLVLVAGCAAVPVFSIHRLRFTVASVLLVGLGGFACVGLLLLERRGVRPSLRLVVATVVLAALAAVVAPPFGSNDVWSYVMYGRILGLHHANPYVLPPEHFLSDPFLHQVSRTWRDTPSVYGPVFALYSALGAVLARDSMLVARLFHQLIGLAALAGILRMVWLRTRSSAAVAVLGLHPVVIVFALNGGHNDLLVGVAILAGILLMTDDRPVGAGVVLGLAILVKVTAGLALVGLVFWALHTRGRRSAARILVSAFAIAGAGYALAGVAAIKALNAAGGIVSRASAWQSAHELLGLEGHEGIFGYSHRRSMHALTFVAAGVTFALAIGLAWWVSRRRSADESAVVGTGTFQVSAAYVLPWYALWSLPGALLRPKSRLALILVLQATFLTIVYELVPDRGRNLWPGWEEWTVSFILPVAFCCWFLVTAWQLGAPRLRRRTARTEPVSPLG